MTMIYYHASYLISLTISCKQPHSIWNVTAVDTEEPAVSHLHRKVGVLVFYYCHNKLPQTLWL